MSDATPETEVLLDGPAAETLRDWASIWADLLLVESLLHLRQKTEANPVNAFQRRGLWEAALVSYARTVMSGRRKGMQEVVEALPPAERELHDAVLRWRNKHVAHRVDPARETVTVHGLLDEANGQIAGVRVRVRPVFGPEEEDPALEERFKQLAHTLRDRIWEGHMVPLRQRLIADQLRGARPGKGDAAVETDSDIGVMFTMDI